MKEKESLLVVFLIDFISAALLPPANPLRYRQPPTSNSYMVDSVLADRVVSAALFKLEQTVGLLGSAREERQDGGLVESRRSGSWLTAAFDDERIVLAVLLRLREFQAGRAGHLQIRSMPFEKITKPPTA